MDFLKAAQLLKEERELISDPAQIAKVIADWFDEELNQIDWLYLQSSSLQRKINQIELASEKASI
jgi:hypothetical protein